MATDTLLIEIGTEELPPASANKLSAALTDYVSQQLKECGFIFEGVNSFVTPRRLAVILTQCSAQQPEQTVERKGPAISAAYDDHGQPTKAALGFARSCNAEIDDLERYENNKGAWLYYRTTVAGKPLSDILPDILQQGLEKLPIPRPMRWGNSDVEFVRPVHWLVVMHGSQIIHCQLKNIDSANITYGHRFHAPDPIELAHANNYVTELTKAFVIADFDQRKNRIISLLQEQADKYHACLNYPQEMLEEVTNLVEWPTAVVGEFSKQFLEIPHEALVVTMQDAQRYFPMFSVDQHNLLPYFITIANVESTHPETIKRGNERVIKPRFEDAAFFWQRDKQKTLDNLREQLKDLLFEKQLGSIYEKTERVAQLTACLCQQLGIDETRAIRAARLSKADLLTDMVNEFPKLQGIMGRYYALNDQEHNKVAIAIQEHYQPLQAGGPIPETLTGKVVAICDRIDTLTGIFATGKKPSGVKDPYALRRAALSIVRIAIEGKVDFDLQGLLSHSVQLLADKTDTSGIQQEVSEFILERLRGYFVDRHIASDTIEAVRSVEPVSLVDFADRIHAVQQFRTLAEAQSLAAGNKRIRNILKKSSSDQPAIDPELFAEAAEKLLYEQSTQLASSVADLLKSRQYAEALTSLAALRPAIDNFFDDVMVMDDNEGIRSNRIALLASVNAMFTIIADISLLQS